MFLVSIRENTKLYDTLGNIIQTTEQTDENEIEDENKLYEFLKIKQNISGEHHESLIYDNIVVVRYYRVFCNGNKIKNTQNSEVVYTVMKNGTEYILDYERAKYIPGRN